MTKETLKKHASDYGNIRISKSHKGEGHRKRLREKFLSSGLSGFHDYEVIELLLTLATPRKDCKDSAKLLLKKFKTLQNVIEAPKNELCEIQDIGSKNIFGIKLIKAVCDRYLAKKIIFTYSFMKYYPWRVFINSPV